MSYGSAEKELTDNIGQYMESKHEKESVKKADTFECGQSAPAPHHEKGSSDQKLSEVEPNHGTKTERAWERLRDDSLSRRRSRWFDDNTREIGV